MKEYVQPETNSLTFLLLFLRRFKLRIGVLLGSRSRLNSTGGRGDDDAHIDSYLQSVSKVRSDLFSSNVSLFILPASLKYGVLFLCFVFIRSFKLLVTRMPAF